MEPGGSQVLILAWFPGFIQVYYFQTPLACAGDGDNDNFNFQTPREKSRRQKCLDWIITWISCYI